MSGDNSFKFLSPPQAADEIGRLGPYRVLKLLGKGGMGVVFLAEDPGLQRTVALKVMLPEVAKRPTARERFLREARATAKIEHDHIVTIYQVGEDRGVPYLAMQLLKGMSLEDLLRKRQSKPTLEQILKLAKEMTKGLAAAHDKGMIHRDIKPANIWLDATAGGRVKILDFGLARAAEGDRNLTQIGTVVGTAAYMAPEQARSDKIDSRADLFSLGCVLYRLCAGRLPWRGEDSTSTLLLVATEAPTPVQDLNPELPPKLAALIMKLLSKKPEDRPASGKAVVEALQAVERDMPTMQMKAVIPVAALVPDSAISYQSEPTEILATTARRRSKVSARRGRGWLVAATAGIMTMLVGLLGALLLILNWPGSAPVASSVPPAKKKEKAPDSAKDKPAPAQRKDAPLKKKEPPVYPMPKEPPPKDPPTVEPPPVISAPAEPTVTPADLKAPIVNSIGMRLAAIPAGEFMMGSTAEDIARFKKESDAYNTSLPHNTEVPQHRVRISKAFYLGAHEVTQGQYVKLIHTNPSAFKESLDHPVDSVNWFDAMEFCKRLSALPEERTAGRVYRLPTEAEWEYACRAGTTTATHYGNTLSSKQANINGEHPLGRAPKGPWLRKTARVGSYEPNAWGLYDMHGNLWEWCLDGPRRYTTSAVTDPKGPDVDFDGRPARLLRGVSWREGGLGSAFRKPRDPEKYRGNFCGFRVLCDQ